MLNCMPLWDQTMSNPHLRTPFGQVELRPVASPPGAEGMQTYVLLPDLDELLGVTRLRPARPDRGREQAQGPVCAGESQLPLTHPTRHG